MDREEIKITMGTAEWFMLLVLSILWGGSFFFVEIALVEFTPLVVVALRVSIAALVIWTVVVARGYPIPKSGSVWIAFLGMGLLNNAIPFTLIVWGQTAIGSGLASILNASTPIFTLVVAGVFLKDEPITRSKLTGCVLGLAGVTLIFAPVILTSSSRDLVAQLAVLAAALSYAIAGVFGRRFNSLGVNPIVAAAGQLLASSFVMIPIALAFGNFSVIDLTNVKAWSAVLSLAILSTALAYVLYFQLLKKAGATNLLLVTLLIPITGILLGSTLLGEQLHMLHLLGIAVIGLGLSVIDGRLWQWLLHYTRPKR